MSDSAAHSLPYRPDIDGLRAIAVLLVVGFHAFPEELPGGFIGVDLFFVISGFLITSIILRQSQLGQFSFLDFYSRRARRIFPALIVLLGCMHLFGWFFMLAEEFRELGRHVAGGSFFVSNFVLFNEIGYFDGPASSKPLLHLWSLGIEEQFYLLLPILIWSCRSRRQVIGMLLLGLAALSFVEGFRLTVADPAAAFYLPHARFWQLLAGSFLAWLQLRTELNARTAEARANPTGLPLAQSAFDAPASFTHGAAAVLGLLLIIFALVNIDDQVAYPGAWALLPVTAGLALIWAGPNAGPNRLLLSRPGMIWIGKISYPLYLWHWPLLSLPTIGYGRSPEAGWRLALVAVAFVLAWATYRFIERPVRARRPGQPNAARLTVAIAVVGALGLVAWRTDGIPDRLRVDTSDVGHREFHQHIVRNYFPCSPQAIWQDAPRWEGFVRCNQSSSDRPVQLALLGDSHAEHYFIGLAEALPERNLAFFIRDSAPFVGNPEFGKIFAELAANANIDTVIISAHWRMRRTELPAGSSLPHELERVIGLLENTGKQVLIMDGTPTFEVPPRACLLNRWFQSASANCLLDARAAEAQRASFINELRMVVHNRPTVHLIETWRYVCGPDGCSMAADGSVLFRDTNHLNIVGSRRLGAALVEDYGQWIR